ncbi:MAG: hypothetical protein A2X86_19620 [Bdellovibrionales bacterium GWA2_49_15]|nr:MAG: hypothetical protein A2X86_19620 [Bdellovibrionales bacterium GWA2_49_15]HAZ13799.1 hypothetical protein [Bdellovibrionales bacterium]
MKVRHFLSLEAVLFLLIPLICFIYVKASEHSWNAHYTETLANKEFAAKLQLDPLPESMSVYCAKASSFDDSSVLNTFCKGLQDDVQSVWWWLLCNALVGFWYILLHATRWLPQLHIFISVPLVISNCGLLFALIYKTQRIWGIETHPMSGYDYAVLCATGLILGVCGYKLIKHILGEH